MDSNRIVLRGLVAASIVMGLFDDAFAMPWQPEHDWTVSTNRGEYGIKDWGELSTLHFASVTFEIPVSGVAAVTMAAFGIVVVIVAVVIASSLITRRQGRDGHSET